MENNHEFKLIDGTFSAKEAAKILLELVSSKIRYHQQDAFSIAERTNGDVSHNIRRVENLKIIAGNLRTLCDSADEKGLHLKVNGNILIELVQPEQ